MKKRSFVIFSLLVWMLILCHADLYAVNEDLFDDPEVRDYISLKGRPIYFDNVDRKELDGRVEVGGYLPPEGRLEYHYLRNRRSLTGESCAINKMINAVGVGSWTSDLGNLLNDDLSDYCEINAVASVGVTVDPIVSVRDRSCYYAKGTEVGFCLVSGSGNTVLSLDVIKTLVIGFYRDGELVGTQAVKEGQDGSGVTLSLIQVPGSDDASMNLTADAPGVFDEISLDFAGGLSVSVGQLLRIKYAFVGKSRRFTITQNPDEGSVVYDPEIPTPFQAYDERNANVDLDKAEGWNPVLLGIPFPFVKKDVEKFTNADYEDGLTLTPILAIGYQGGAKFMMKDTKDSSREIYEAGTEVGFNYTFGSGLSLDAGAWVGIVLFDHNGKKLQEITLSANVLGLSVAKGGSGSSSIVAPVAFSGAELRFYTAVSVNLGAIVVHYAYVSEETDIRHHCPINPSANTNLCEQQTSLQLRSNPQISVSWTLESQPEFGIAKVSEGGYVTNIDVPGDYIFRATAADGCFDEVTVSVGMFGTVSECGIPIVNKTATGDGEESKPDYVVETAEDMDVGITGGLISVGKLENPENLLSDDLSSYATYVGGLEVATNVPVIGLKSTNGLIYDATKEPGAGKRIGFVVASEVEGLNVGALQFWQVRCYHNGVEVYRSVVDESNAVSADVGGANASQKMRYSIAVPDIDDNGKPTKVDEIILWSSGLLDIEVGKLNIYYPFIEDINSKCNDPLGCSSELLSASGTHTTLDFDLMQGGSAIVVANAVNDLDNFVDDDPDSYMSLANSVSVGDGLLVAVKLGRTLDYKQQLGIIMDNKTFVAGVNVGSWLTVETYYNGEPTGDKFTDWNAVDANVAGYGDQTIIYIQPTTTYDEVKITIAKTIAALDVMKFYGLFYRSDADHDGIPDCQDPESCSDNISDIFVYDVCVGDMVEISAKGVPGSDYSVSFSEPGIPRLPVSADADGNIGVSYETQTAGMYDMVFYDGSGTPLISQTYMVHPLETTWKKTTTNRDWNKWDNWSNGSPYCCTNVIIPSDATVYPELAGDVAVGDEFCCDNIHFEPRAEVSNINRLNYSKAWVELELPANRYHLISAPLKKTFTGDMFIPRNMQGVHTADYFTLINASTAPENRFDPTIYQRRWYGAASEKTPAGDYVEFNPDNLIDGLQVAKWTNNFNHLAYEYRMAEGTSLWIDNGVLPEDTRFRFRFPKEHTVYNYYVDFDQSQAAGLKEDISRMEDESDVSGRFIYESATQNPLSFKRSVRKNATESREYDRMVYLDALPCEVTLSAAAPTGHFLFGNPLMSRIDAAEFLRHNSANVRGLMTYDGNTTQTIVYDPNSDSFTGELADMNIHPLQAVFAIAAEETQELSISFSEEMIAGVMSGLKRANSMRIIVEAEGMTSSLTVTEKGSAAENVMLLDNEVAPRLCLYAAVDGKALDIVEETDELPLVLTAPKGASVKFRFESVSGFNKDRYQLEDIARGVSYSLEEEVNIPVGSTSAARFLLRKIGENGVDNAIASEYGPYLEIVGDEIVVRSNGESLCEAAIYDLEGRMLEHTDASAGEGGESGRELRLHSTPGIRIISIRDCSGRETSFRIILR